MAATLIALWSRLVPSRPATDDQSATETAELFRDRLLARAVVRDAADWLENRVQVGRDVFRRGGVRRAHGRAADITDLLRACLVQLRVTSDETARHTLRLPRFWRMHDALGRIERLLEPDATPLLALLPPIGAQPRRELQRRAAVASTVMAASCCTRRSHGRQSGLSLRQSRGR